MSSHDVVAVQDVERAAGEIFREIGMPEIADDEPLTSTELDRHLRAGLAWVADGADGHPVAYLVAQLVDASLHVEQVSVHPTHARRGIGRTLMERAEHRARAIGAPALTLTAFRDVPWNAPYYMRCGFVVLGEPQWTPGLRAIREGEAARGLDRWPRVCMRRGV